jgi:hypothetical protein
VHLPENPLIEVSLSIPLIWLKADEQSPKSLLVQTGNFSRHNVRQIASFLDKR